MKKLFDFLYFDSTRLRNYVSQIKGGLLSIITSSNKEYNELSVGINVGIPIVGGKVNASNSKEHEYQQTLQLTDSTYFDLLYRYLKQFDNDFVDISNSTVDSRKKLYEGQFIEMHGIAEQPVINWGDRFQDWFDIKEKDPYYRYIRALIGEQDYGIYCSLISDFIVTPLISILPAEIQIFGRIKKIVPNEARSDVFDLLQIDRTTQRQNKNRKYFFDLPNRLSKLEGKMIISESDFQVKCPDILITPIVLYQ